MTLRKANEHDMPIFFYNEMFFLCIAWVKRLGTFQNNTRGVRKCLFEILSICIKHKGKSHSAVDLLK